ncbi:hypothetical protein [Pseudomonas sp. URMO17WK12:I2]
MQRQLQGKSGLRCFTCGNGRGRPVHARDFFAGMARSHR